MNSDIVDVMRKARSHKNHLINKELTPMHSRSTKFSVHMVNRMNDITRRMGFTNLSEFIRYAVRKELDFQAALNYMPGIDVSYD